MIDWLNTIDTQVFLALNGLHAPYFDAFMKLFTGKWIWVPMYAAVLFAVVRNYRWRQTLAVLVCVALARRVHYHRHVLGIVACGFIDNHMRHGACRLQSDNGTLLIYERKRYGLVGAASHGRRQCRSNQYGGTGFYLCHITFGMF